MVINDAPVAGSETRTMLSSPPLASRLLPATVTGHTDGTPALVGIEHCDLLTGGWSQTCTVPSSSPAANIFRPATVTGHIDLNPPPKVALSTAVEHRDPLTAGRIPDPHRHIVTPGSQQIPPGHGDRAYRPDRAVAAFDYDDRLGPGAGVMGTPGARASRGLRTRRPALAAPGLSKDPFHEPFHARGLVSRRPVHCA